MQQEWIWAVPDGDIAAVLDEYRRSVVGVWFRFVVVEKLLFVVGIAKFQVVYDYVIGPVLVAADDDQGPPG